MRALAVMIVVVFHAPLGVLRGGWLGVDIFFVLSGFLITTLLIQEKDRSGAVSLRAFYARRAFRILPAVVVLLVLLTTCVYIKSYPKTWLAGVPWVIGEATNWERIGRGLGPLDHLWSLAVEEQFYLLWPLLLLGLNRLLPTREAVFCAVAVLAVGVTALRMSLYSLGIVTIERAYLGSDLRSDTLLYGCLLGIAYRLGWLHALRRWWRLAALPATAILIAVAFGASARANPHLYGPIALASAVLVAFVLTSPDGVRWLRWNPLVRVGVISYGIYLWHYPVMWALMIRRDPPAWVVLAVGAGASMALAAASWRFVETPALRMKKRFERTGQQVTDDRIGSADGRHG